MNLKHSTLFVLIILFTFACAQTSTQNAEKAEAAQSSGGKSENVSVQTPANSFANATSEANKTANPQANQPKTLREFFALLPAKYFTLEGCEPQKDKNCEKARAEYIKNYLEIEDSKNGYWKSGCDGAQMCLEMALFKRADASYIVHVLTMHEMDENSYFLEYKDGNWTDISAKVVPEYTTKNTYVPPRKGTTVEVFKKNYPEPTYSERGAKIYDLTWNDGKFSIKK